MSPNVLRIASLDCEVPVPNVLAERGTFGDIFEKLLRKAAETQLGDEDSNFELKFRTYNAKEGELPSDEELSEIDGIILTGSGMSVMAMHICSFVVACGAVYTNVSYSKLSI